MVIVMTRRSPRCRASSSSRAAARSLGSSRSRGGRRKALLPVLDQLAARAFRADERLQLGLEPRRSRGVLARDVGQEAPGAVEESDAIGKRDAGVFELLVDREDGLQALERGPARPAVERLDARATRALR